MTYVVIYQTVEPDAEIIACFGPFDTKLGAQVFSESHKALHPKYPLYPPDDIYPTIARLTRPKKTKPAE